MKNWVAAIAVCFWFQLNAQATPLDVSGNTSWQQNGSVVTISVDRISNTSPPGPSGSIRLELWATATRYAGGTINGYVLASYQFSQVLGPNRYYANVSQTVPFTTPPNGTYYTTLTLEEYNGSAWVIQDSVTYDTTNTFGPGGGSPANTSPFGYLDYPPAGASVNGTVPVYGWVLDAEDPNLAVSFSVDGQLLSSSPARAARGDVCNAYRTIANCSSSNPGWSFNWNTQSVTNGAHTLSVVARDPKGAQ